MRTITESEAEEEEEEDSGGSHSSRGRRSVLESGSHWLGGHHEETMGRERHSCSVHGKRIGRISKDPSHGPPTELKRRGKRVLLEKGPKQIGKWISTKRKWIHFENEKGPKKIAKGHPNVP